MKKYFLYKNYGIENNAGPKAKRDIDTILKNIDFKGIEFNIPSNKYLRPFVSKFMWKRLLRNRFNSLIICQYPFYSHILEKDLTKEILKEKRKKKNNTFVAFIHDIESLRLNPDDVNKIKTDLRIINSFDFVVCHNSQMKKWLMMNGITSQIMVLELFDYLSKDIVNLNKNVTDFKYLNFAGNIMKAKFLTQKFTNLNLNIFGPNFSDKLNQPNYSYKGEFSPEEVPLQINGGFGLIWDGTGSNQPNGVYGNYLKYITPHKLSLYLRSGIPVIAWTKSAIAPYIIENNVGFVINDLTEIDEKVNSLTVAQYQAMKKNCMNISNKIQEGKYTKNVITKIINKISN